MASIFVLTVEAPQAVQVAIFQLCVAERIIPNFVRVFAPANCIVEYVFCASRGQEVVAFFDIVRSFTAMVIVERVVL